MAKNERTWHPNFIKYMEFIIHHDNYSGLPIVIRKNGGPGWVATKKSEIGKQRLAWALMKARELNIPNTPGVYAKVMLQVHPTKRKVCQVCGKEMSLYYEYPNSRMVNELKKTFNYDCTTVTHINTIISDLLLSEVSQDKIKQFLIKKISLSNETKLLGLDEIIRICEQKCRIGESKMFGPGAMSNFPDRYDGFHSYNRCCRGLEDTGRSKENLKTYTKDRRAYEYWSDGNIHAANKFMGSNYFYGTSADHIGPISLGFVHDSHYLRAMSSGNNSAKRDRLQYDDIKDIILVEEMYEIPAISWYSRKIWEHIKQNYQQEPDKIGAYRIALKQNLSTYMLILWEILERCGNKGKEFLAINLLLPKNSYFLYDYSFNSNGEIIEQSLRKIKDSTRKEFDRFVRVAIDSIKDYHLKENRNVKDSIDNADQLLLGQICKEIMDDVDNKHIYRNLEFLMENIQDKQIAKLE